jgi:NADPH:quinone reductase-like Zn-dependent oxidoreductase
MKAALVGGPNQTPVYGDVAEPVPGVNECRVTMRAAALSHVAKSRATGDHYSSAGGFPLIPGIDGVGVLDTGQRVYCLLPEPPLGTMAEVTIVPSSHCIELPPELDATTAAAMAIPGMSSWAALTERARFVAGETVLVNGATGISGSLAVQIAKHLGAAKVIATGRNRDALHELTHLGADVVIPLTDDGDALEQMLEAEFHAGVDVVLDYLWGESARRTIIAAAKGGAAAVPIRFVQIGSASGPSIALPSAALRSSALELMGSGLGSVPFERLLASIDGVFAVAGRVGFRIASKEFPLSDIATAWTADQTSDELTHTKFRPRFVLRIGQD